jgi:hypothetical protein
MKNERFKFVSFFVCWYVATVLLSNALELGVVLEEEGQVLKRHVHVAVAAERTVLLERLATAGKRVSDREKARLKRIMRILINNYFQEIHSHKANARTF